MPAESAQGAAMPIRTGKWIATITVAMALVSVVSARKKEKVVLPMYVLKAQTVLVVILPNSGEPMDDITANRKAQEDVEKAFMKWGRYRLALDADQAELVVAVRKGTGKIAGPTINAGRVDSRPGTIETTDNQIRIGVQQGHPPDVSDPAGSAGPNDRVHPGVAVGQPEDTFQVFQSGLQYPLDNPPVWKLIAKDGLKPPEVAAVQQFRKAVEESEKAAQQKQQAQQQANQQGQKSNP
jgi:hypothetical protein